MGYDDPEKTARSAGLELIREDGALCIRSGNMTVKGDFSELAGRIRLDRLSGELLVRAAKPHEGTKVIDATAGLGEDAFLLAATGCRVTLFEKDPVIHALLEDALIRGKKDPSIAGIIDNMEVFLKDSTADLKNLSFVPDIVYLDPMFPERRKSGLVKKKFQLLKMLELPCEDEQALMEAAVATGAGKIIVKRPIRAPELAGARATYTIRGNTVRYDCIVMSTYQR